MLQIISLFCCIFIAYFSPVFAVPSVIINNLPDNSILGENFSVDFFINNADIGSSFYYKVFGGIDDNTSSIQNFYNSNYLNYTSSWIDFPITVVSTNSANLVATTARISNNPGLYNVRIRIAKISNTSTKYDSETRNIDIIAPSPTPTQNPTPTPISPTNTPIPTPTIASTPTKTLFSTPSPTKYISPIPTPNLVSPTHEITNEPTVEILGVTDIPTPTVEPISESKEVKNFSLKKIIPNALIVFGGLLLFIPLFLTKIKYIGKKKV